MDWQEYWCKSNKCFLQRILSYSFQVLVFYTASKTRYNLDLAWQLFSSFTWLENWLVLLCSWRFIYYLKLGMQTGRPPTFAIDYPWVYLPFCKNILTYILINMHVFYWKNETVNHMQGQFKHMTAKPLL